MHADIPVLSDERVKTESVDTGQSDVYDDIGELAEVCRCKMPLKCCINILKDKNQCKAFQSRILSWSLADSIVSLLFSGLTVQNRKLFVLLLSNLIV